MGTNKIISIFNMLLYQPIGELYYFNIPLVKYQIQERSLSTYSETGSKLSTQYHYILDCIQKRLLCTYSPLYVVTDTGATWLEGKPPSSWLESVQSEMRLALYYFIILIFNSLKGREGMRTFGDFQKNGKSPLPPPGLNQKKKKKKKNKS